MTRKICNAKGMISVQKPGTFTITVEGLPEGKGQQVLFGAVTAYETLQRYLVSLGAPDNLEEAIDGIKKTYNIGNMGVLSVIDGGKS